MPFFKPPQTPSPHISLNSWRASSSDKLGLKLYQGMSKRVIIVLKPRIASMRIAQIAPLYESVPPKLYGGTERVVAHLSDALVRRGHEVVLFASGDSGTEARLVACRETALRLDEHLSWDIPAHLSMLAEVRKHAASFDIIHFHLD